MEVVGGMIHDCSRQWQFHPMVIYMCMILLTLSILSLGSHVGRHVNEIFVIVEVLLNIKQISEAYPHVSTLYTNPASYLRCNNLEIAMSDVISVSQPPPIVLTMDQSCHILQQQAHSLSHIALYCSNV